MGSGVDGARRGCTDGYLRIWVVSKSRGLLVEYYEYCVLLCGTDPTAGKVSTVDSAEEPLTHISVCRS